MSLADHLTRNAWKRIKMLLICVTCLTLIALCSFSVYIATRSRTLVCQQPMSAHYPSPTTRHFSVANDPIINDFKFSYPISMEDACTKLGVDVFIPVYSAVTNFQRRQMARNSPQGRFADSEDIPSLMMFFVGTPSPKLTKAIVYQEQLVKESNKYKDVIQMNIVDTYRNLSLKAIGVLKWISQYCSDSKFVLKIDDDCSVDPLSLLSPMILYKLTNENFIVGDMAKNEAPKRCQKDRNFLSVSEFSYSTFPLFTFGPCYGYPTTTALLLYQQAIRTKMIYLEDVFITGICRTALGIPIFHDHNFRGKRLHKDIEPWIFVYS